MIVVLNMPADNPDEIAEKLRNVAGQIESGYTSGYVGAGGGFWHSEGLDDD